MIWIKMLIALYQLQVCIILMYIHVCLLNGMGKSKLE